MASTTTPSIGIPYARAIFDEQGYGVQCPACDHISRAKTTKSASRQHGLHWVAVGHREEDAR